MKWGESVGGGGEPLTLRSALRGRGGGNLRGDLLPYDTGYICGDQGTLVHGACGAHIAK